MHPVVMLAGGMGSRVAALTGGDMPKALLDVAGRPFLDRRIDDLRAQGVDRVVILAGHGADQLRRHVESADLGVEVELIVEGPALLGTGGAIASALGRLPDTFWVTYADTFLEAPMAAAEDRFHGSGSTGLMTVLRNEDRWQPSNVEIDAGLVTAYDKRAAPGTMRYIDYGLLLFHRHAFTWMEAGSPSDLADVIRRLVVTHSLQAFEVFERFHDIGTPQALAETARWVAERERRS